MEIDQQQQIKKYLDLLLRRKKMIITSFLLAVIVGLGIYLKTPKVYEANSLIMYQQQKINPSKMSPDEMKRIGVMVNTVSQQVTSRTSLEKIIEEFDLYSGLRKNLPLEDVIEIMREKHISIKSERRTGDVFNVSYKSSDARKAMLVTNALAARFIEENLRYREERAMETSAYIKGELAMAKEDLDKKEAVMRDYKLKYYNEMAEQRQANMARLNALQEQYQSNRGNVHNLEQTRLLVLEQISLRQDMLAREFQLITDEETDAANPQFDEIYDLNTARKKLEAQLARYTELHPDVRRLKSRIRKLEEDQTTRTASSLDNTLDGDDSGPQSRKKSDDFSLSIDDPQLAKLGLQLKEIELNLTRLEKGRDSILEHIEGYQQWVDAAPIREAEWAALTRDYDEFKKHYGYLVAQSLAAQSAESLERKQKGSQFKIVDPAYLPEKPIKPDFRKIMLMALTVGLGLGCALALGLEFFDTSFKEAADIEEYLGLQVTCSIPVVLTNREARRRKIKSILWVLLFTIAGLAVGGAIIYPWWKGYIIF